MSPKYKQDYLIFNSYHLNTSLEINGKPCIGYIIDTVNSSQFSSGWQMHSSPAGYFDAGYNSSGNVQMIAASFIKHFSERQLSMNFTLPIEHTNLNQGSRFGRFYEVQTGKIFDHY